MKSVSTIAHHIVGGFAGRARVARKDYRPAVSKIHARRDERMNFCPIKKATLPHLRKSISRARRQCVKKGTGIAHED